MAINNKLLYQLIGDKIKSTRYKLGMSQEQLAKEVGVTRTSITNIERGFQKLPIHLLYKICEALHTELEMVLPTVNEAMTEQKTEIVEIDGKKKSMLPKTASFVRDMLENLKDNDS